MRESTIRSGGLDDKMQAMIERIEACDDETKLLSSAVGLISSHGHIPFVACGNDSGGEFLIHHCHTKFTDDRPRKSDRTIPADEGGSWKNISQTLAVSSWQRLNISRFCASRHFEPDNVIVCPFKVGDTSYFFLLADYRPAEFITHQRAQLDLIISLVAMKIENLHLVNRLARLDAQPSPSEATLRESKERYRSIFNSNADAFLVFDVEGNIVDANGVACRTYGYTYDEITRLSGKDIVHPDYQYLFGNFKSTEPGHWFQTESVDIKKGGIPFDIEIHGTKLVQEGSELLLAIVRDITERKTAEHALSHSEEKYRNLVEHIEETHFLYSHDTNGVFTYVSPTVTQILGYSQQEFRTHFTRYLTSHPVNEQVIRHTELSIRGIRQPPYQVEISHKNGSVKWLEVSESPQIDERGNVDAVHGIARDITEKQMAEQALLDSKKQLRATFDNAAIGMMIAAPMGPITRANKTLVKILGYSETELLAVTLLDLVHPDDRRIVRNKMLALLSGTREALRLEKRLIRKDGRLAWGRLHVSALRGPQGRVNLVIVAIEDITNLKQIEEVVRQKDVAIRESYANVIRAITGDRLIISSSEEVTERLGEQLAQPFTLTGYEDLQASRSYLRSVIQAGFPNCTTLSELIAASGEAAANMVKHANGGTITAYRKGDRVQLLMSDTGGGIHFSLLSKATLLPGFSTKQSLGVGFSIMLEMSDQVILSTEPGKTSLLLERQAYQGKRESSPRLIHHVDA